VRGATEPPLPATPLPRTGGAGNRSLSPRSARRGAGPGGAALHPVLGTSRSARAASAASRPRCRRGPAPATCRPPPAQTFRQWWARVEGVHGPRTLEVILVDG
jgi:hypothetical protein